MYQDHRWWVCVPMGAKLLLIGFMLVLAGLDLVGTMLAKEWTVHREAWQLIAGAMAFVALFLVLALGLRYAEMSIVTLGWIVVLQAAVVVVDRSRYGTTITPGGWVAIMLIVVLQGYLVLGATTSATAPDGERQPSAASAAS
jgi:multidrug transporter EmrE-like cation transporter